MVLRGMMDSNIKEINDSDAVRFSKLLVKAAFMTPLDTNNPWIINTDTLESVELAYFTEVVEACRFFYRKDPIIGTAINKMVEIGINELKFYKNGLTENEFRVFLALKDKLEEYAEVMALEFLVSGLVIPEISYGDVNREQLKDYGIKKYNNLVFPTSMWLRDPATIKINKPVIGDEPSYYVKVPEKMAFFITHEGVYQDGTSDKELYKKLVTEYPEFVREVNKGTREILLDNKLIIRRKVLSDSPYPTPFISPAIESLKHKRNLRRMDYSIASRAIGAIQLFNLGSDTYPITEENQEDFDFVKAQMYYRNGRGEMDLERIFQLFANHTLRISWVYPPLDALLNEKKYSEVNSDIIFSLGFPRILITGETEKSGTSTAEYAMMGPVKSMESFRKKIIVVINDIVRKVAEYNNFKTEPIVKFKPLNLFDYKTLLTALKDLYDTGNVSRTEYANEVGFNWNDSQDLREAENKVLQSKNLEDMNAKPFSNPGRVPGQPVDNTTNQDNNAKKSDTSPSK